MRSHSAAPPMRKGCSETVHEESLPCPVRTSSRTAGSSAAGLGCEAGIGTDIALIILAGTLMECRIEPNLGEKYKTDRTWGVPRTVESPSPLFPRHLGIDRPNEEGIRGVTWRVVSPGERGADHATRSEMAPGSRMIPRMWRR